MGSLWPEDVSSVQIDPHGSAVGHANHPGRDCHFFLVLFLILKHLVDAECHVNAGFVRKPDGRLALDWHVDAHRVVLRRVVVRQHVDLRHVRPLPWCLRRRLRTPEVVGNVVGQVRRGVRHLLHVGHQTERARAHHLFCLNNVKRVDNLVGSEPQRKLLRGVRIVFGGRSLPDDRPGSSGLVRGTRALKSRGHDTIRCPIGPIRAFGMLVRV